MLPVDSEPDWSKTLKRAHPVLARVTLPLPNGRVVIATGVCWGGAVVGVMRDYIEWADLRVDAIIHGGVAYKGDIQLVSPKCGAAFLHAFDLDVRAECVSCPSPFLDVGEPVLALEATADDEFVAIPGRVDAILPNGLEFSGWASRTVLCFFKKGNPTPGAALFDDGGHFVGHVVSPVPEKNATMVIPAEYCSWL